MKKIDTFKFGEILSQLGYNFYSGVPCSFLKNLINYAINECTFVMSANEGDAVAVCAGASMAGAKSVVLMQNSGLTNAVSPLTSLNYTFKIPVLGFVSLRGEPGLNDEPQHELMGKITGDMLSLMEIEWDYLSPDLNVAREQVLKANSIIEKNKQFFFIVKKGTFDDVILKDKKKKIIKNEECILKEKNSDESPLRYDILKTLSGLKDPETILLATTGKTGRELYEIGDAANNFYMVGSMGCISAIGLGLSVNANHKKFIAVDGDGALLMRMGNLATNAYYGSDNFLHLLIDNNMHDSTGGQETVSHNIDFVKIAAGVGYKKSVYLHGLKELEKLIIEWKDKPKLTFAYIKAKPGTIENLGRPKIKPFEVKKRLMDFINEK